MECGWVQKLSSICGEQHLHSARGWCSLVSGQLCWGIPLVEGHLGHCGGALDLLHGNGREKVETDQEECELALELGGRHMVFTLCVFGKVFVSNEHSKEKKNALENCGYHFDIGHT